MRSFWFFCRVDPGAAPARRYAPGNAKRAHPEQLSSRAPLVVVSRYPRMSVMPRAREEALPFEQRARSFGSIAEHYARFRPPPPQEAVDWVLGEPRHTALDLGAGTGALTALLVQCVRTVVAAEPDPEMRSVLHKHLPRVPLVAATAEALPFGSATFDAVLVSSAWHWMDPDLTPIEVGRVLETGRGARHALERGGQVRRVGGVDTRSGPADRRIGTPGRRRPIVMPRSYRTEPLSTIWRVEPSAG